MSDLQRIEIVNREKDENRVTFVKELLDNAGKPIDESRTFGGILTGPSFPWGIWITIDSANPLVFQSLKSGEYTFMEYADFWAYDVKQPSPFIVEGAASESTVTITNTERANGGLTIRKVHEGTTGDPLDENEMFTVRITGPSFPDGVEKQLSVAEPVELWGLIYGDYVVEELDADDYVVNLAGEVTLSLSSPWSTVTVTNTYVSPTIELTARKVWVGGTTPHPTIRFQLFRDGEAFGDPVDLADGTTTAKWTVDATDANREPYVYTVAEVSVPEGYEASVSDATLTVTNRFIESGDDGGTTTTPDPVIPTTPTTPTPTPTPTVPAPATPSTPSGAPKSVTVTVPAKKNPKTGDGGALPIALVTVGAVALVGITVTRRRRGSDAVG